jgi:hypothetical protein
MTIEQQIKMLDTISGTTTRPVASSFLREWAEMTPAAPVMCNDHPGSLYPAEPAPSGEEIRRSIAEFAKLMA